MNHPETLKTIREKLTDALSPSYLEVIDDSQQHIGHPGAQAGGGHFTVRISSPCFDPGDLIGNHRQVFAALGTLMKQKIHALRIDILDTHS